MNHEHVVVTGAAGFIGSHVCEALLSQGRSVWGIDNFSPNYCESYKRTNVAGLSRSREFRFIESSVGSASVRDFLSTSRPDVVIHLAATPGVRPSLEHVLEYIDNNVRETAGLLASAVSARIPKFIFASSSSVYGHGSNRPSREDDPLLPLSPYAATKVSGEALCSSFAACHDISITCLRFFTVYGPRQRPDMGIHLLARSIHSRKPFRVVGNGQSRRDYTYIADIVSGICASLDGNDRFAVFNLGSGRPIELRAMIDTVSSALGKEPILETIAMSVAEPNSTFADCQKAKTELGFNPTFSFQDGVARFAEWYSDWRKFETE